MTYRLKIQDPSGETRSFQLKGTAEIGYDPQCAIPLRDSTLPPRAAQIDLRPGGYWIQLDANCPSALLGSLEVREAQVPFGISIKLGETRLTLDSDFTQASLPEFPSTCRPWLTQAESGRKLLWMTKKAACTPLAVYIAGETGSGKEVIAGLIHAWSERASGPFVPLNCGALSISLAESELFGHLKGSFTGADQSRPGALMQAHGGTLFLDEVGDLSLDLQVKLLRFLENGEIRAVGSDKSSRANVRLICATHKSLKQLVEEGKFRRDLYYRIASITLEIPPLRSRLEDIEMLAQKFAHAHCKALAPRSILRLKAHSWPGNVRELCHAVDRACGMAGPFEAILSEESFEFLNEPDAIIVSPELELGSAVLSLEEMERVLLLKALRITGGNRTEASRILGVARSTLFEMLKRHKIQGPRMQVA